MKILDSIAELAGLKGPIVLAAGTFDGLHIGHMALISRVVEEAKHAGGTAVVMTFDRHPALVVRPESAPKLLTTNEAKIKLLDQEGVQALLLLKFTQELAAIPAGEFIGRLASASKPLRAICVGSQWSFGSGGSGNIPMLLQLGKQLGFSVAQIAPVRSGGEPISSTRIRNAIAIGDFDQASACLGRTYLLTGNIVTGAGLGATIGFHTANLDVDGMQLPPDGVYAVRVIHAGGTFKGVANIGLRPTVNPSGSPRTVEVHIFDFSENLVGKELSLEFVQYLRGEMRFPDLTALSGQISKDCDRAREVLQPLPCL